MGKGVARIVDEGLNHVVVEATADQPGYVVLADAFFPGWRATVDGVTVPIERANHALRAVKVMPGSHRIRFDYRPPGLTPGLWISACTFAGLLLFVGLSAFRDRRPRGEPNAGRGISRCLIVFGLSGLLFTQEAVAESPKGGSVATSRTGEMVFIPAGRFLFGKEELAESRYQPAFYVDKFEVANGQYGVFLRATRRGPPRFWEDPRFNGPNHPVVGMSWFDAGDYCRWAGKRLPSEAEWEKAARGTDGRVCPWGNHDCLERGVPFRANHAFAKTIFLDWFDVVFEADGYRYTAPVGRFPKGVSPYGVHDLAGNVWEWIGAVSARQGDRTEENLALGRRLQRGGAWSTLWFMLFTYHSRWSRPELNTSSSVGFRCAKDP